MTVGVLLAHGWCFGHAMWKSLEPLLHTDICITPDFGYFCEPNLPSRAQPRALIGIGHSFGSLWLLKQRQYRFDGLVLISAVPNFCRKYGRDLVISEQDLISARTLISRSPQTYLRWFYKKCGLPISGRSISPGCINEGAILRDLEYLSKWTIESELENIRVPIRVLGANNDHIVTPTLLSDSFKGYSTVSVEIENHGGHILPILNPEKCAETINDLIRVITVTQVDYKHAKKSSLE
ncbi:MAG: alpha/beta hydrolase [Candidatus Thiodiazotropha sp.]